MEKHIKPCKCGSSEFISKPNRYDVYEIENDELVLVDSHYTPDKVRLYCRSCSKELKAAELLVGYNPF